MLSLEVTVMRPCRPQAPPSVEGGAWGRPSTSPAPRARWPAVEGAGGPALGEVKYTIALARVDPVPTSRRGLLRGVEEIMSEYSAVRGGKLKLKSGLIGGQKKKKRKREHSKHDEDGEYKHGGKWIHCLWELKTSLLHTYTNYIQVAGGK